MTNSSAPSPKVTLSPTRRDECEALLGMFSQDEVVKYTNFRNFSDSAALGQFLDRFLKIGLGQPLQYGPYSIYLDNQIIGLCGLQQHNLDEGVAELWYILNRDYWKKGLARQAIDLLINKASENKQLKTIFAEAVDINIASWKILEKLGFSLNGITKSGFKKGDITEDLRLYSYACPGVSA